MKMNQSKRLGEETELATPVELAPGSAIPEYPEDITVVGANVPEPLLTGRGLPVARVELSGGINFSLKHGNLPLTIGRDSACDIQIPLAQVSRQHCRLSLEHGMLQLTDCSTNGTVVGDRLLHGDSIALEKRTRLTFTDDVKVTIYRVDIAVVEDS